MLDTASERSAVGGDPTCSRLLLNDGRGNMCCRPAIKHLIMTPHMCFCRKEQQLIEMQGTVDASASRVQTLEACMACST